MPLGQKSGQKYLLVFIQNTNANRHWPTGHFVIDRNWPNHPLINNSVDLIWNWINWYCYTVQKVDLIRQKVALFYWFPFSFPHWKSFLMIVQRSICCREWPMTASITSSIQKIPIWGKQRGDDSHLDHFPSRFLCYCYGSSRIFLDIPLVLTLSHPSFSPFDNGCNHLLPKTKHPNVKLKYKVWIGQENRLLQFAHAKT